METKKTIAVDFDGVLHQYSSGWHGPNEVADIPVKGAIGWLINLVRSGFYEVVIFSSRNSYGEAAIVAMKEWLEVWGMPRELVEELQFPLVKPPYFMLLDDRAMKFEGEFPSLEEIEAFDTWHRIKHVQPDVKGEVK